LRSYQGDANFQSISGRLLEGLGNSLEKIMIFTSFSAMEIATFYQNPDFDEIFVFVGEEVSSSKDAFKPVRDTHYFEKHNKSNSQAFVKRIKEKLLLKKKKRWPYKGPLMLAVGVSGIKKIYGAKDLDNVLKSVFDAFKGIVFDDDEQIQIVIANKQIWEHSLKGFMVGLRVLSPPPRIDKYVPILYGDKPNEEWVRAWTEKSKEFNDELFSSFETY
jgi:Holliday junction resolvase RusA-like endonuclease